MPRNITNNDDNVLFYIFYSMRGKGDQCAASLWKGRSSNKKLYAGKRATLLIFCRVPSREPSDSLKTSETGSFQK